MISLNYGLDTVDAPVQIVDGRGMAASLRSEDVGCLATLERVSLVPGSLNLIGEEPVWLDKSAAVFIGKTGHCFWRAKLNEVPILLNRWAGPAHVYEAFSEHHLRSLLKLKSGDHAVLSIPNDSVDFTETRRIKNRVIWFLVWSGRRTLYYKSNQYLNFVRPFESLVWRSNQF